MWNNICIANNGKYAIYVCESLSLRDGGIARVGWALCIWVQPTELANCIPRPCIALLTQARCSWKDTCIYVVERKAVSIRDPRWKTHQTTVNAIKSTIFVNLHLTLNTVIKRRKNEYGEFLVLFHDIQNLTLVLMISIDGLILILAHTNNKKQHNNGLYVRITSNTVQS